ncbi:serine hydrolase [Solwaraspora sp. WMMD406]|uniref:serine hydrolase domain-containing protein n=1 Tax=Solwaraspora sp. WMMD406 TaxID=3016095 RepID=UPI002417D89E|nr:serine hydrolase domain-containing protein [Solwaraspora sp. WMMD406]MDG4765593.1 serine hydrolase [Solwaraspora sp. WMMD406]
MIDTTVAQAQARGRTPSVVLGVLRHGRLAHVASAGRHPVPDRDLQYRIGSITKTMTAALVLQLRDAGVVDLDDPLRAHLPDVPFTRITLRQLLGHAAGLQREPDSDAWWERTTGTDLAGLLATLTPDKVALRPHTAYHYSNLAYGLLGAMTRRLTSTPWSELVRDRVLDPLGMSRTSYHPAAPFAPGYVVHPWHGTLAEEPRTDTGAMAPAGQLWSTVEDLSRWAAFLTDPDPAVLAPETMTEMCRPVAIDDPERWTGGHGLGPELYRVGERVFAGHGGSMPGYVALLAVHRPTRTGVVAFANSYGFADGSIRELGLRVLADVLDREPEPVAPWLPGRPPAPPVAPICGRWWWMGREFQASWDAGPGELVITQLGRGPAQTSRFTPDGPDRWRGTAGTQHGEILAVRRDPAGHPRALDIATFVLTRDPDQPDQPG